MTLKVTAPMVTARTDNDRIVYLYFGDVVPDGLSKDSVDHLKNLGFIKGDGEQSLTAVEQPEDETPAPVVGGEGAKPAGNAGLDEWSAYARTQGATDDDLAGLSRNDVRDLYK